MEWFSREVLATPLRAFPEHKRSFLPSRDDQRHIARIVHALKMGWTKTRKQIADERRRKKVRATRRLSWLARFAECTVPLLIGGICAGEDFLQPVGLDG